MKLIRNTRSVEDGISLPVDWTISDKDNLLWKSYSIDDDLPIWSVAVPDESNWMNFEYQLEGTPSEIFMEVAQRDCWADYGEGNLYVVELSL